MFIFVIVVTCSGGLGVYICMYVCVCVCVCVCVIYIQCTKTNFSIYIQDNLICTHYLINASFLNVTTSNLSQGQYHFNVTMGYIYQNVERGSIMCVCTSVIGNTYYKFILLISGTVKAFHSQFRASSWSWTLKIWRWFSRTWRPSSSYGCSIWDKSGTSLANWTHGYYFFQED